MTHKSCQKREMCSLKYYSPMGLFPYRGGSVRGKATPRLVLLLLLRRGGTGSIVMLGSVESGTGATRENHPTERGGRDRQLGFAQRAECIVFLGGG